MQDIQCILPDLFICTSAEIAAHCHWLARSLWFVNYFCLIHL